MRTSLIGTVALLALAPALGLAAPAPPRAVPDGGPACQGIAPLENRCSLTFDASFGYATRLATPPPAMTGIPIGPAAYSARLTLASLAGPERIEVLCDYLGVSVAYVFIPPGTARCATLHFELLPPGPATATVHIGALDASLLPEVPPGLLPGNDVEEGVGTWQYVAYTL
jgi:hypothetical protein